MLEILLLWLSSLILGTNSASVPAQRLMSPLSPPPSLAKSALVKGDGWYVVEQNDQLCEAGSRHYAGRINVTDDKSIFYCKLIGHHEKHWNLVD